MRTEDELRRAARKMRREAIVKALESVCIQSHDHETNDELEEALVQNILDGTLDEDALDGY